MSLQKLLKMMQTEVKTALEELTCITTHDDNLERQYKEGGLAAVMPGMGMAWLVPSEAFHGGASWVGEIIFTMYSGI